MPEEFCCIDCLIVIAGRKQKKALADALSAEGARLMHAVYGRGSIHASHLKELLGLVPEEQKVLIHCLIPQNRVDAVMNMLATRFGFDRPNTGVAFTIPIEKIAL